ncbi:unnamed protein product, partial [Didymodactylos carnosus]
HITPPANIDVVEERYEVIICEREKPNDEQLTVREETALLNEHQLDTTISRQQTIRPKPSQYGHGKQQRIILDDTTNLNRDDYQILKHHASEAFVEQNEIQYGDSFGRASLNQIKPLNAPSVHSTQVPKSSTDSDEIGLIKPFVSQHAVSVDDERYLKIRLIAEKTNRASVVYDTEWTNEKTTSLVSTPSNLKQQANDQYAEQFNYQKPDIRQTTSIYSRAKHQLVEQMDNEQSSELPAQDNRYQSIEREEEKVASIARHHKHQLLGFGVIEDEQRSSIADEEDREEIEQEKANEVIIEQLANVTHQRRKTQLVHGLILDNDEHCSSLAEDRNQDIRELATMKELIVPDTLVHTIDQRKQVLLGQGMLLLDNEYHSSIADDVQDDIETLADEQFVSDTLIRAIEQEEQRQLGYGRISYENEHRLSIAEQDMGENDRFSIAFANETAINVGSDNEPYAIDGKSQSLNALVATSTIFCRPAPVSDHDDDDLSLLSEDSMLLRHQYVPNTNLIQDEIILGTDKLTFVQAFSYPQHEQEHVELTQIEEQQQITSIPEHDHINSEIQQHTPMYLPLISQLDEPQKTSSLLRSVLELLHDNVNVENELNEIVLSSSKITSQPLYRTKPLEMLEQHGQDESRLLNQLETLERRDKIDSITLTRHDTMTESVKVNQPVAVLKRKEDDITDGFGRVNLEINIFPPRRQRLAQTHEMKLDVLKRPQSTTSSFIDVESFLSGFEDSLDQHQESLIVPTSQELPLLDQVSLSHMTSLISDDKERMKTEKAIEQYERESSSTSRKLPTEWYQQEPLNE